MLGPAFAAAVAYVDPGNFAVNIGAGAAFGYRLAWVAAAGLVPALPGQDAVLLAVSIVGATIMPHVVYLHSALTASRIRCHSHAERARVLRHERWDVISALCSGRLPSEPRYYP
jgi:Mn2+/Fe2+ NRAMP family transporter